MKVLVSPVSLEEARIVVHGGADILDIKNVKEGSLGAQAPWVIQSIVKEFTGNGMVCSATLGDLPYKPGTAALAAYGAASCGVKYIKAGLHGMSTYDEAVTMMEWIVRAVRMVSSDILVVASGYADYRRFNGVSFMDVVRAAKNSGSDGVMLDTAIKDGKNLFDAMTCDEIKEFIDGGKDAGLLTALAGSITTKHMETLGGIKPDIVGIRGAVCDSADRTKGITLEKVQEFMAYTRKVCPEDSPLFMKERFATAFNSNVIHSPQQ